MPNSDVRLADGGLADGALADGVAADEREADLRRRVRIGLTGLGGVVAAILVAGAIVNHTAREVLANATRGMVPANSVAATDEAQPNDPLAGIGAAPAAKPVDSAPVEEVPGTGAVVNPATGNVSDLPPS